MALVGALTLLTPSAQAQRDTYGGIRSVVGRRTGYYHVEKIRGRWWIITPGGHGFISKGVCHIAYTADHAPTLGYSPYGRITEATYGTAERWAAATARRLKAWGFNTVGAWSSPEMHTQAMAYAPILNIAASLEKDLWLKGGVVDVFAPAFEAGARKLAMERCRPLRQDPWVLGYFTDNELRWGPDWRSQETLLDTFLKMPADSPGRRRAEAFLKRRKSSGPPTDADASAFLGLVAERYFKVCRDAIKAADPNHMIIGCRFGGYAPDAVLQGLRRYVDVISYNDYGFVPPVWTLDRIATTTGRPLMLTEFSFKARDSGLPNTRGAGLPVETQNDRADRFEGYVTALMKRADCVGYHWFEWCDEPKEGRFDGENSNYGLVRIDDTPWEVITARMTAVNDGVEAIHAGR